MRKIITFLVASLFCVSAFAGVDDFVYINSIINSKNFDVYQNTIISDKSVIASNNVNVKNSVYLQNMGEIYGNVNVSNGYSLYIQNSGSVGGQIYLGNNSSVFQVIKNDSDITNLNINGSYTVLVQTKDSLSLTDIINISGDTIILNDSKIYADYFNPISNIELSGENVLITNDVNSVVNNLKLLNVSGNGTIYIQTNDSGSLFNIRTVRNNDEIHFELYRETDYQKILGNSSGRIINNLRGASGNSRFISAMDRAGSVSEIYDIMNHSVMFNPINLMRPVKLFNSFAGTDFNIFKSKNSGIELEPIYISNQDMDLYSGKLSATFGYNDWSFKVSGYAGKFDVADNINEFSGLLYGGSIKSRFDSRKYWTDLFAGFTGANFKTNGVLNGSDLIYNPNGTSIYGGMDTGLKFKSHDFYFSPFVGIGAGRENVVSAVDSNVYGRTGGFVGTTYQEMGLLYNYQIFISAQTDKVQSCGIKMKIWSFADGAGGSIDYEVLNDEIGISHKISGTMKVLF